MKVFINAASVKEGGSRVVLRHLLAAMCEQRADIDWTVAAHPECFPDRSCCERVTWLAAPVGTSPRTMLHWYEWALPKLLRGHRADVLFSQTNYLPRRKLPCPTLLLVQHAGHFSPIFDELTRQALASPWQLWLWQRKRRRVHWSARAASLLTVQTQALAGAVEAQTRRTPDRIAVIPHGPGAVAHLTAVRPPSSPERYAIGYISKGGVQKDFATLFRAAQLLRIKNHRFKLVLTLDQSDPENRRVLRHAQECGIDGLIENRGEIEERDITAAYDSLDVFVFASLCESFGFPLVEAMARGLPLVVAATCENLEVTGKAALSFPPGDAERLAAQLECLMLDNAERRRRAERSLAASRAYDWRQAGRDTIAALERAAGLTP